MSRRGGIFDKPRPQGKINMALVRVVLAKSEALAARAIHQTKFSLAPSRFLGRIYP